MKNFNVSDNMKSKVEVVSTEQKQPLKVESKKSSMESPNQKVEYTIEISMKTIAVIMMIAVGLYLGFKLLAVITILFFAFAVASALLPIVRKLTLKKVPKGLSIGIVYLAIILVLLVVSLAIAQPLQSQIGNITTLFDSGLDGFYEQVTDTILVFWNGVSREEILSSVQQFFAQDLSGIFDLNVVDAGKAFSTVTAFATFFGYFSLSLVLSVYIIFDHDSFLDLLILRVVDDKKSRLIRSAIEKIEEQLGSWLRGQVILSLIIGGMVFVFLSIVGVPYALPLALLAGLLETIPALGPTLSAVPAILTALFALSPIHALIVTVGYMILQWLENNLIVPRVMGSATGLKPVVVILAVFIGFTLFGIIGAIFAVPTVVVLRLLMDFYLDYQKIRAEE
jgi:predicted PurR-regulated permease PerM